ncbi:Protein of unknown function DUF58 [Andreprevotia lacus DSM 23236]|jgi:uncharacterized protein (DUF58 family)|uniref:DUF58 domain-containing protein n=1 Tax=Andreprevotia lacus DSM 23236 TaxID=1121001 RepID=A0A1W1XZG0_9NEIS|nr:DUF58 domain-containing protein [Andreprevotia lacus]SMC28911.1 Protein of unknown function DUF58 [Andreprevotia lacus DSM 23236]
MKRPAWLEQRWQRWLARRHPPGASSLALRHNRIYVLPSGFGFAFAAMAVLVLVGAINYQISLAYSFAFLMIGLGHAGLLHGFRNLLGLKLTAGLAEPVFAGESAHFPIRLDSEKPRQAIMLRAGDNDAVAVPRVDPPGGVEVWLPVGATERGWLTLPKLGLETHYPSQLCRVWSYANLHARCLVYPRPEPDAPSYRTQGAAEPGGEVQRTGDDDFAGLRRYQPGDPIRRIAWKQAARDERLSVKQYESPQSASFHFDWHDLPGMSDEARLSRLTAWVLAAENNDDRYGLILPGARLPLDQGPVHCAACLTALALYGKHA